MTRDLLRIGAAWGLFADDLFAARLDLQTQCLTGAAGAESARGKSGSAPPFRRPKADTRRGNDTARPCLCARRRADLTKE